MSPHWGPSPPGSSGESFGLVLAQAESAIRQPSVLHQHEPRAVSSACVQSTGLWCAQQGEVIEEKPAFAERMTV